MQRIRCSSCSGLISDYLVGLSGWKALQFLISVLCRVGLLASSTNRLVTVGLAVVLLKLISSGLVLC